MAEEYTESTETSAGARNDDLTAKLKSWVIDDMPKVVKWREEARTAFGFYAGGEKQWDEKDIQTLRDKRRPVMSFNRTAPLVNAVVGSEINNRREVQYIPREEGDALADEILTAAGEWFRDQTSAEDEESDAFEDTVITGMGWTDTRLDFECDPDGAPIVERSQPVQALVNDTAMTRNVSAMLIRELGSARVKDTPPEMASEDFSQFQLAGVPTLMLRIGAVEQSKYDAAMKSGAALPTLHSSKFAPDREPAIKTAMLAEVLALRQLMPANSAP